MPKPRQNLIKWHGRFNVIYQILAHWPFDQSVQACSKGQILQNISMHLEFHRKQFMSPISIILNLFSFLHISLLHFSKMMQQDYIKIGCPWESHPPNDSCNRTSTSPIMAFNNEVSPYYTEVIKDPKICNVKLFIKHRVQRLQWYIYLFLLLPCLLIHL